MLESFRYKTTGPNCGATVPSRTGGTERDEAKGADDITLPDVLR